LLQKDRHKYEDAINKLGAQVLQSASFCEDVTHVLMSQPSKSEKYLCSLASGKWILHPSYIDACLEKNCFLPVSKNINYKIIIYNHIFNFVL
jgi:topoisomerase (DNA) II binding protein 1